MAETLDNDTLEMAGDWKIIYGYYDGPLGTDASGHLIPPGSPTQTQTFKLHFDLSGPGEHGGKKYKGTVSGWPGTYDAETYYDQQGVQLLHMVSRLGRTVELHCGAHYPFYQDDPKGVHIVGSWINCGGGLSGIPPGLPYHSRFVMVKEKRNPK